MVKSVRMKRSDDMIPHRTLRNRDPTPHPLPTNRTPLASKTNTVPLRGIKKFMDMDKETEEELEEVIEARPTREVKVETKTQTPVRKRKNLVDHSFFADMLALTPGPSKRIKDTDSGPVTPNFALPKRGAPNSTLKPTASIGQAGAPRSTTTDNIPVRLTELGISSSAGTESPDVPSLTPVEREFKIPPLPKAPKKKRTPRFVPKTVKSSPKPDILLEAFVGADELPEDKRKGNPSSKTDLISQGGQINEDGPTSEFTKLVTGEAEGSRDCLFEPDGQTREIYVQGSKMIVKAKVEKAIYPDGSPSDPSEEISAHIASTLQHFMVPYLHYLTLRHTGPMAPEYYLKDLPIIYHIQQVPHQFGNTFNRSSTVQCLMWEEIVVTVPYLIPESPKEE